MYEIKSFDHCREIPGHVAGANKKVVLVDRNNRRGFFKFAKVNNGVPCGEYWSEKMAKDLADLVHISCMEVDCGMYNEELGSMCYDFTQDYGSFLELAELLFDENIKPGRYTLRLLEETLPPDTFKQIIKVFMFDFIIGNGDRHSGNLGVLESSYRLSPLYDNGSSLCCRLDPNKLNIKDQLWLHSVAYGKVKTACLSDHGTCFKAVELVQLLSALYLGPFRNHVNSFLELDRKTLEVVMHRFSNIVDQRLLDFIIMIITERVNKLKELASL